MKALMPLTAAPLDVAERDAWLAGDIPRRMLAVPFGGPIPSPKSPRGVDLDGQWFSERTDLIGGYPALRKTRERIVDWHHSLAPLGGRGGDPTGKMAGVTLGKAVLDDAPDEAGLWADFWLAKGRDRLALVKRLVERGAQLFASAQPVAAGKADRLTGEILEFPLLMVTVTTSPQNTLAVVTAKALLADLESSEVILSPALRGLLDELSTLGADLPVGLPGLTAAKADGRSISTLLAPLEDLRDFLRH